MSHVFQLHLATDTLETDAQRLGTTTDDLLLISAQVRVSMTHRPQPHLSLAYEITLTNLALAAQLDWPAWQQDEVVFSDYLWERTCLECFIGSQATDAYIEINASPNGRYALYRFDGYRHPPTMPPPPLLKSDGHTQASITWKPVRDKPSIFSLTKLKPVRSFNQAQPLFSLSKKQDRVSIGYEYRRRFDVFLEPYADKNFGVMIDFITPCIILKFAHTSLYFATRHASPPDFHCRDYWLPVQKEKR